MNINTLKTEAINCLFISCGCSILALGVAWFFVPNGLLTGGSAGLSLLLHYITSYNVGSIMIVINLPLLLLGYKYLGKMFTLRTIFTILLVSFLIDFSIEVLEVQAFVVDPVLASIFGGIFIGLGLGLVIKGNASAGGSTIVASIISSRSEIKASSVILCIDSIIIVSALFVFDDRANVLWSIVSIYVTTKIIDFILTGSLDKKVVYLVTNKIDLFKQLISAELGPHGTILQGHGLENNEDKRMILIVVEVSKLQVLRQMIKDNDEEAFLIISEANEMLGRGH